MKREGGVYLPYTEKSEYLVSCYFGVYSYVVVRFLNMLGNEGVFLKRLNFPLLVEVLNKNW